MFTLGETVMTPDGVGVVMVLGNVHADGAEVPQVTVKVEGGDWVTFTGNKTYNVEAI